MTETKEEVDETAGASKDSKESKDEYPKNLAQVPCIRYLIIFWKKSVPVSALFDLNSEVNAIYPTFAQVLGLTIRPMDVVAQKIDSTILDTFGIIITAFLVTDKANRIRFFEKTFLVANISLKIVFRMFFLTLSVVNVNFLGWELRWRTYTTKEALSTIKCIELVGKKRVCSYIA